MQGIPCIVELVAPKRMPNAATEKPNNSQNRSKQVKHRQGTYSEGKMSWFSVICVKKNEFHIISLSKNENRRKSTKWWQKDIGDVPESLIPLKFVFRGEIWPDCRVISPDRCWHWMTCSSWDKLGSSENDSELGNSPWLGTDKFCLDADKAFASLGWEGVERKFKCPTALPPEKTDGNERESGNCWWRIRSNAKTKMKHTCIKTQISNNTVVLLCFPIPVKNIGCGSLGCGSLGRKA